MRAAGVLAIIFLLCGLLDACSLIVTLLLSFFFLPFDSFPFESSRLPFLSVPIFNSFH